MCCSTSHKSFLQTQKERRELSFFLFLSSLAIYFVYGFVFVCLTLLYLREAEFENTTTHTHYHIHTNTDTDTDRTNMSYLDFFVDVWVAKVEALAHKERKPDVQIWQQYYEEDQAPGDLHLAVDAFNAATPWAYAKLTEDKQGVWFYTKIDQEKEAREAGGP